MTDVELDMIREAALRLAVELHAPRKLDNGGSHDDWVVETARRFAEFLADG
jgi:hypothetical protein